MKLDLIILSYGLFKKTTKLCLESITADVFENDDISIFVYDNNSKDDSCDLLIDYAKLKRCITVLINKKNLGYGGGMNLAVKNSSADWVFLVNSDIIFSAETIPALLRAIENAPHNIALITPLTNNAGNAQCLFAKESNPSELFEAWQDLSALPLTALTPQHRSDFCCVAIRRDVWVELKGLDPVYGRGYYEDFDFSIRAQNLGYGSAICENAVVFHAGSASFSKDPEQSKLIRQNKKLFLRRHPTIKLVHQRVENYSVLKYYLKCLSKPLPETERQAIRVRLTHRVQTAWHTLPKSFLKKLYWKYKIKTIVSHACHYFPEMKTQWLT